MKIKNHNFIKSSFDLAKNREMIKKTKESSGKSGSFFFITYDYKFIIKIIKDSEKNVF
jgi:1-phosphatidylinositol-4-phosphate 5-kinase